MGESYCKITTLTQTDFVVSAASLERSQLYAIAYAQEDTASLTIQPGCPHNDPVKNPSKPDGAYP